MQNIPDEKKQEIIKKLQEKNVKIPCPRCNHNNFILLDGYFTQLIQNDIRKTSLSGEAMPFIVIICTNCGHINQHALGILGLMPDGGDDNV